MNLFNGKAFKGLFWSVVDRIDASRDEQFVREMTLTLLISKVGGYTSKAYDADPDGYLVARVPLTRRLWLLQTGRRLRRDDDILTFREVSANDKRAWKLATRILRELTPAVSAVR